MAIPSSHIKEVNYYSSVKSEKYSSFSVNRTADKRLTMWNRERMLVIYVRGDL